MGSRNEKKSIVLGAGPNSCSIVGLNMFFAEIMSLSFLKFEKSVHPLWTPSLTAYVLYARENDEKNGQPLSVSIISTNSKSSRKRLVVILTTNNNHFTNNL